jgi:hypothetical protein
MEVSNVRRNSLLVGQAERFGAQNSYCSGASDVLVNLQATTGMKHRTGSLIVAGFFATALHAQVSVCDLFKDLKAADGHQLIVTGELILSKGLAVLGAADCDNQYRAPIEGPGSRVFRDWPVALNLRPSVRLSAKQIQELRSAAGEADRLRLAGKIVRASASFTGRIRVVAARDFPAELTLDSFEDLKVEALTDPSELPVIPICELFQNLPEWKGKRIAVRGESSSTFEGSWIVGRCKGSFYTNGYRWPVVLDYAAPAYYSRRTARFSEPKWPSSPPKGEELFRGRNNVVQTATYVGRLRMRGEYVAVCRGPDYFTNGFGHLGAATAELIVEAVRDVELTPRVDAQDADDTNEGQSCELPNLASRCLSAASLLEAASLGCVERVRELLAKGGYRCQRWQ